MSTDGKIISIDDFNHSGKFPKRNSGITDYARISWVYACVNRIATTASGAPLVFYDGDSANENNRITDPDSDILKLFSPPNPPQIASLNDLINRTFVNLGISGKVFWVFSASDGGDIPDTVAIRSSLRPILSDPNSGRKFYSQGVSGTGIGNNETLILEGWYNQVDGSQIIEIYEPEVVLPILYYNPYNVYDGLSPLTAARISIDAEKKISNWNSAFFKIGMKNPIIVKSKGTMTTEQKVELRKEIRNYYSGIEGGQGALLLGGNVEVTDVKISTKDVDFIKGKELNREEIAAIYGVPPALLGIFNYSNYSNTREQRQLFWENTLLPQLNLIADLIKVNVLDRAFPGYTCKWEIDAIAGIATDPVEVSKAASLYFNMGVPIDVIGSMLKLPALSSLTNEDLICPAENCEVDTSESDNTDSGSTDSTQDDSEKSIIKVFDDAEQLFKTSLPIFSKRLFASDSNSIPKSLFLELLKGQTYSILKGVREDIGKLLGTAIDPKLEKVEEVIAERVFEFLYLQNQKVLDKEVLKKNLLTFFIMTLDKIKKSVKNKES